MNWKRRLSTTAKYNLLFWVFIVFGSWQITRNAIKSESVALKRTNLAVIEGSNFSSSFRFVPSHSARSLSGVIKIGYSSTSAGQPDFIPSVTAVYNSYRHFSRSRGGGLAHATGVH